MANQTAPHEQAMDHEAAAALAPFVDQQTVLLTTFRRDGSPVGTPVNMAVEGDHGYFRTWDEAGKFKRLRHTPEVTVAPSTVRGVATGPAIRAHARVLAGEEDAHAASLIRARHPFLHGIIVPLTHRLRGNRTVHFEVRVMGGG